MLLHLGNATIVYVRMHVCMLVRCCLATKSAHAALSGQCNYHMHVCMFVCMYVCMYVCTVFTRGRLELTVPPYIESSYLATGQ